MTHRFPLRVYYEDTDFTGVVYHASYLRFAERGRSEYLREIGISHAGLLKRAPPLAFVVRHMAIDFLKPARIDDALIVETGIKSAKGARFEMAQQIKRDSDCLWQAELTLAIIDTEKARPARAAQDIIAQLTKSIL